MMRRNPVLARLSGGLSLAVLAAVLSFGSPSALRADEEVLTPALLELIVNPIVKTVEGLEQRLMHLEASVGGWAESLMTRRLVVQQICLADDSGAQTCVTKGQLDALIGNAARAEIVEPADPTITPAESAAASDLITEPAAEAAGVPAAEPVSVPSEPVSIPQSQANASPAPEAVMVVVPTEASATSVTELDGSPVAEPVTMAAPATNSETEARAEPTAEPAAIAAPTDATPATPIALPVDGAQHEQELEHTGTIAPEGPAATVNRFAPLPAVAPEETTVTEEAPGDEYE